MSRQYLNPPIREVVCEFRYQEDGTWDGAAPGLVYAALNSEFPRRLANERTSESIPRSAESPNLLPPALQQIGLELRVMSERPLRFWRTGDESGYISLDPYRLSVHHFSPYPSWAGFRGIVEKVVRAYQEVLEPSKIQRIGLRYINDVQIEQMSVSLEEYFDYYPFIGSNLSEFVSRFHCVVQMEFEGARDLLTLQIASPAQPEGQNAVVTLDLDYFLAQPDEFDISESTNWLESAHSNVEKVFEGCLKDSVRALFL